MYVCFSFQVRNFSDDQRDVLLPDLRHGWQYQPLAREGRHEMHWRADDPTLTVEALGGESRQKGFYYVVNNVMLAQPR